MKGYRTKLFLFALLAAPVSAIQAQQILYNFGLKDGDPAQPKPVSQLVEGPDGSMYGMTPGAAIVLPPGSPRPNPPRKDDKGAIFRITPDGQLTVLYRFDGTLGATPLGGVTIGKDGTLYGTAYGGGKYQCGTVFRLGPGEKTPTVLWEFMNGWFNVREPMPPPDELLNRAGSYPVSPPVPDAAGNLYGVTAYANNMGSGVFYTIPKGGKLKAFCRFNGTECKTGIGATFLMMGNDGNLYGMTNGGPGTHRYGAVFRATTAGQITTLHWFDNGAEGSVPSFLMQGSDGALYGTAGGGIRGVVFRLTLSGEYKVLHNFHGNDGMTADSLVQKDDGYLYGITGDGGSASWTHGVVFRMKPDGSDFCVVHEFGGTIGSFPAALLLHSDNKDGTKGSLYGMALGGSASGGVFFRLPFVNPIEVGLPGDRSCCALGWAKGLDPTALAGHQYGNTSKADMNGTIATTVGERAGYVYTANGGLVDIGHVRDNADVTFYVYEQLAKGNQKFYMPRTNDFVSVPTIPCDRDKILELAGAIAYVGSWGHELQTWGETSISNDIQRKTSGVPNNPEDFSAFSPEDLPSNIVGIELAVRAIRGGGDVSVDAFNSRIDAGISILLAPAELNAQSQTTTDSVLHQVEFLPGQNLQGKWWMNDLSLARNGWTELLRRNFDGVPWLLRSGSVPVGRPPAWLNADRFRAALQQFFYLMNNYTNATMVPQTTAHAAVYRMPDLLVDPAAKGETSLQWTPIPNTIFGKLDKASSVFAPPGQVAPSGQFTKLMVNGTKDVFVVTMKVATDGIRNAFVQANGYMDRP